MDDLLTPAEVWCSKCDQPSTAEYDVPAPDGGVERRAYCTKHDPARMRGDVCGTTAVRYVPDAITDPWLRRQYAQATGARLR